MRATKITFWEMTGNKLGRAPDFYEDPVFPNFSVVIIKMSTVSRLTLFRLFAFISLGFFNHCNSVSFP
jgi:hypothetical protein